MRTEIALACLISLAVATPALAHHISGNVYCDQDLDGTIDVPGDTPIPSITVQATSLDFNPGELFSAMTDGSGAYFIALPPRTDLYRVELINLPPGYTVVVPVGGSYDIQIITGTSQDRAEGVNFLVQGCAETTTTSTTTSTSTTTTSTTTSSTTTTSTSTTTTTTSSTTTTTVQVCECDTAFLVRSRGKFNNGATIVGSVVANDLNGSIKFGKQVNVADDTTVIGDTVRVGNGSSIDDVLANDLRLAPRRRRPGPPATARLSRPPRRRPDGRGARAAVLARPRLARVVDQTRDAPIAARCTIGGVVRRAGPRPIARVRIHALGGSRIAARRAGAHRRHHIAVALGSPRSQAAALHSVPLPGRRDNGSARGRDVVLATARRTRA